MYSCVTTAIIKLFCTYLLQIIYRYHSVMCSPAPLTNIQYFMLSDWKPLLWVRAYGRIESSKFSLSFLYFIGQKSYIWVRSTYNLLPQSNLRSEISFASWNLGSEPFYVRDYSTRTLKHCQGNQIDIRKSMRLHGVIESDSKRQTFSENASFWWVVFSL